MTMRFKRGDIIVEHGDSLGVVLQSGRVAFDVIWIGGSTSRYRYSTGRHVRLATAAELAAPEHAFTIKQIKDDAEKAWDERRRGARVRRAGGPL